MNILCVLEEQNNLGYQRIKSDFDIFNLPISPVHEPFLCSEPTDLVFVILKVKFSLDCRRKSVSAWYPWKQLDELHPSSTKVTIFDHSSVDILLNKHYIWLEILPN